MIAHKFIYTTWVPQAREGAVLVPVPGKKQFVLFGGVNQEPMSGIAKLEIKEGDECSFELVVPDRIPETKELEGRFAF